MSKIKVEYDGNFWFDPNTVQSAYTGENDRETMFHTRLGYWVLVTWRGGYKDAMLLSPGDADNWLSVNNYPRVNNCPEQEI